MVLFRKLLQRFCKAYPRNDYDSIEEQFKKIWKSKDEKLPLKIDNYIDENKEFHPETYWIDCY